MSEPENDEWSNYEQKTKDHQGQVEAYETQQEDLFPRRKWLHNFFIGYSVITAIVGVLLGVAQFLTIAYQDLSEIGWDVNSAIRYMLSVFLFLFCVVAVFTELEWTPFIRNSRITSVWVTRGLLYVFMGVLALDQNNLSDSSNSVERNYVMVVAYMFLSFGAGYVVMGLLCLQILLNKYREDYKARLHVGRNKRKTAIPLEKPADFSAA